MKLTPIEFVKKYAQYAKEVQEKSKIPALFILSQAALESGWDGSAIGKNIFGITASNSWRGLKQLVQTNEYLDNPTTKFPEIISITKVAENKWHYVVKRYFRDYETITDCFNDHLKVLMQPNFAHAIGIKDCYEYAKAIQDKSKCKGLCYATAPKYADIIRDVSYTVKRALAGAGISLE